MAKFTLQKYLILINKNIFINLFNKKNKRFYNKWVSDVDGGRNQINSSNFLYFYGGLMKIFKY
jgi:hypothetical protein